VRSALPVRLPHRGGEAVSETDRMDTIREGIDDAFRAGGPPEDADPSAVLVRFVGIGEFMDPDGGRWLTLVHLPKDAPEWETQGLLFYALHRWDTGS
jgi:hypothetical protein